MPTEKDTFARWLAAASILIAILSVAYQIYATHEIRRNSAVKRSGYWQAAITGKPVTACVPEGTKVITPDTPTIFRDKCPKGWQPTMMYYKGPSDNPGRKS